MAAGFRTMLPSQLHILLPCPLSTKIYVYGFAFHTRMHQYCGRDLLGYRLHCLCIFGRLQKYLRILSILIGELEGTGRNVGPMLCHALVPPVPILFPASGMPQSLKALGAPSLDFSWESLSTAQTFGPKGVLTAVAFPHLFSHLFSPCFLNPFSQPVSQPFPSL